MTMTISMRSVLGFILLGLCGLPMAHAAEGDRQIDPRADRVLRAMGTYLKDAREFTFRSEVTYDQVRVSGQKLEYGRASRVAVVRPNRLHAETQGDLVNDRLWYNGKTFTVLDLNQNAYSSVKVPGSIDKALDFMVENYGVVSPIADVVQSDPYPILVEQVQRGEYLGLHSVGGTRCHHLAFTQANIDWQMWVEDGGMPVPRKIVIVFKHEKSAPRFTALLSDWNFSPKLSKSLFDFTPPEAAIETDMAPLIAESRDE